jgi:hypothetical protein
VSSSTIPANRKARRGWVDVLSCGIRNRLDHILVSPELADLVTVGGINRNGLWTTPANKKPLPTGPVFSPLAASEHAAVWIGINL